ncbi:MAG: tetratricopeptide repeat protein [Burkholderiales bacterium]|nr:tetratricopeptide repeat protein [Burkholderiales bacterium]
MFMGSRISRSLLAIVAAGCVLATAPVLALDAKPQTPPATPLPENAIKPGSEAAAAIGGRLAPGKGGPLQSLEFAASQGNALAMMKLGQMYADGDGVPRDDVRAFEHFKSIYDRYSDESEDSPNAPAVAKAYVALGSYLVGGIPNSYVRPNPGRARELFDYAATIFGDPHAQYNLAMLQFDGVGGPKEPRKAVRWLNLAAQKGHVQAQAVLGNVLFFGESAKGQKARGLMWLMLASDGADQQRDKWILDLMSKATAQATEGDRARALEMIEQQFRRRS